MKCRSCSHTFEEGEHFVMLKEGVANCENCFFDKAIKKMEAIEKQYFAEGIRGEEEE